MITFFVVYSFHVILISGKPLGHRERRINKRTTSIKQIKLARMMYLIYMKIGIIHNFYIFFSLQTPIN